MSQRLGFFEMMLVTTDRAMSRGVLVASKTAPLIHWSQTVDLAGPPRHPCLLCDNHENGGDLH